MSAAAQSPEFCVWKVPGEACSLRMTPGVVAALDHLAQSLGEPNEWTEVGGILFGTRGPSIVIEKFWPVYWRQPSRLSCHLSATDLQQKIGQARIHAGRNLDVVGYCRSHNREDFTLEEGDLAAAKEYLSDAASVFLLIRLAPGRGAIGGLFLSKDGQVSHEANLVFPLHEPGRSESGPAVARNAGDRLFSQFVAQERRPFLSPVALTVGTLILVIAGAGYQLLRRSGVTLARGPAEGIEYVAPQPVHRVAPVVPSRLRRLAAGGVRIGVKVSVDVTGRVTRAEPVSQGNAETDALGPIAADAARQWRFSPARRGNQVSPAETIIQFQFGGGGE